MNMNTPGISLFQGAESMKMNSSLERAEEEEEAEDQRRRNEEIGNLLQNAFDDLDDDETTIDSTTNFQHDQHDISHQKQDDQCFQNNSPNVDNFKQTTLAAYESEIQKLRVLLESRTNELTNIKQMAKDEYNKGEELQKRLTITAAELERALASKQNTHELLVESKEKCSNLENSLKKLRLEKKALEDENNSLLGKLETCQTLLADVQRKYDMVERDLSRNNDRNAELRRKHQDERHRAEIELLQQKLEQLDEKLQKKIQELESMNTRYNALQNSHDIMLVDKGSKINELNNALNEAQKKCEELLCKEDYFQENIRLQKLVASLQEQIMSMERTISSLNEKLELTTAEIDVMDSILHQHNLEGTPKRLTQTYGKVVGSTPMNTIERVGCLKDELYRALANVKSKRDEVRKLQQAIDEKNQEIRNLKLEENKSLVVITTLKEDKLRLENRLKIMDEELSEARQAEHNASLNNSKMLALNEDLKQLRQEHNEMKAKHKLVSDNLKNSEEQRTQLDMKLKNAQVDLEELKQEHDSMKLNFEQIQKENQDLRARQATDSVRLELEKHKYLLKDAQAECERLKKLYIEISNEKETLNYELEKLRTADNYKELQEQLEKVANLQRAVQLGEMKSRELAKILETEKVCHERDIKELREKLEKEKSSQLKAAKDNANTCTKCIDYLSEITKREIENLKISNLSTMRQKEIDNLNHELQESKSIIEELSEKLKLSDHQEKLIKELKTKATQFEDYIKSQNASSASEKSPQRVIATENTGSITKNDKSVATSPELRVNEVKRIEARIREEMAKIFATEIKRYQMKLKQCEEEYLNVQHDCKRVNTELQQRQKEVLVLKQAILAEREKIEEMLQQKDEECQNKIIKHNQMLQKCRDEIQLKNKRISELVKELDERQKQIEAERQSMKVCMSQWEVQQKNVDTVTSEWREKLEDLKKSHESAMAAWQAKYNSAKHTARNYKRYAEDKEAHMLKEYERIKVEYDATITKLEARLHEELQKRDREMKETIAAIEKKRSTQQDNKENRIKN